MAKNSTSDEQDYYLWTLLGQARDAVFRIRQNELVSCDISERQASILFIIDSIGHKATPAEIARWLLREPQSISEILNRMEEYGLIKKNKDLRRKNQIRVEITEKGRKIMRDSLVHRGIPQIMSVLSEEERRQLTSYLLKLRNEAIKRINIRYNVPIPPLDKFLSRRIDSYNP